MNIDAPVQAQTVMKDLPAQQILTLLAGAAGPTALFALGAALAVHRIDREKILTALSITAQPARITRTGYHVLRSRKLSKHI